VGNNNLIYYFYILFGLFGCDGHIKSYNFNKSYIKLINRIIDDNCCDSIFISFDDAIIYDTINSSEYNSGIWLKKKGISSEIFKKANQIQFNQEAIIKELKYEKPNSIILDQKDKFIFRHKREPFKSLRIKNSNIFINDRGSGVFFLSKYGTHYTNYMIFIELKNNQIDVVDHIQIDTNFPW